MEPPEAREILMSLVAGRKPGSAEQLPSDCIIHQAGVLRALMLGINGLDHIIARDKRRSVLPGNVGHSWTVQEEERVRSAFLAKEPLESIAKKHGRTQRAVEARLVRMGVITEKERTTRGGFASPE